MKPISLSQAATHDPNADGRHAKGRLAFNVCLWVFVTGCLLAALLSLHLSVDAGAFSAAAWLKLKPWLVYWRLGLFLSLVGGWPCWVGHYARWANLDTGQQHVLRHYRWRFALILLMIEAILVQRVFAEVLP